MSRSWYLRCVGGEIGILDQKVKDANDSTWYSYMDNGFFCGI